MSSPNAKPDEKQTDRKTPLVFQSGLFFLKFPNDWACIVSKKSDDTNGYLITM
jgi:hypothetical protein